MEDKNKHAWVLVTGGSGFVGVHCILQLMQKGYSVKTTLRAMNRKNEVIGMLKEGGFTSFTNLEFTEADLTKDDNWDKAVKDCTYVLHVASPIQLAQPKDENEMIRPAVDGALRVLKAASDAGVKRVVMTSNFGAVGYSHKDPKTQITEEDWTDPNQKGLSTYNKSKVLAERAAWEFINNEGGDMELSVINPVAIFGPSLGPDLSSGFDLIKTVLDGKMKAIPNMTFNIVDVRDVADLHIRAMTNPEAKGQRFLALAGGIMSLPQIARLLKAKMPQVANDITTNTLPNWMVRVSALFDPKAKAIASMLGINRNTSNAKARRVLNWQPIANNEEAVLASVQSMLKFGNIK